MGSIFSCNRDRIVVRQILDPYVNAQYVASHEVTLGRNGNLSMKKIQSLRMFGDEFLIVCHDGGSGLFFPRSGTLSASDIKKMVSFEDECPVLTVIERCDAETASKRLRLRKLSRKGEDSDWIRDLKGVYPDMNRQTAKKIFIRQTLDPHASDVQYVASYEGTLEDNGDLRVNKIRLGIPRDQLLVLTHKAPPPDFLYSPPYNILSRSDIKKMASFESGRVVLSVVERRHARIASERRCLEQIAKEHEEWIKSWKDWLLCNSWNWLGSGFSTSASQNHDLHSSQSEKVEELWKGRSLC